MSDVTSNPVPHHRPNYAGVFLSLFVLTIIEIFVANLNMSKLMIILALIMLAIVKASLVAMFYMHLRFEKLLLTVIAVVPFLFSFILAWLVGVDLGHPRP